MKNNMWVSMIVSGIIFAGTIAISGTIYVDTNAGGSNTGTDWTNAYTNLQTALAAASFGDEIWVAQGTYKPGATRADSFNLATNTALYGGFASGDTFADRDWTNKETILSGDIGVLGVNTDNCYHIVTGTNDITIDGFTIRDGYAGDAAPNDQGSGYYTPVDAPHYTIANCLFDENFATNRGGAIYIYDSDSLARISNSIFRRNHAYEYGGAIYLDTPNIRHDLIISDCTFIGNSTSVNTYLHGYGGAIYLYHIWPKITNCVFTANSANYGGGAATGNINYRPYTGHGFFNCIFSGNYGRSEGGGIDTAGGSLPIIGCTFMGNYAYDGGGLQFNCNGTYDDYNVPVNRCIFAGNFGAHRGGGFDIYGGSRTTLVFNCSFVQNNAPGGSVNYGGGGISTRGRTMADIKNSIFYDNQAVHGDAVFGDYYGYGKLSYSAVIWNTDKIATNDTSYPSEINNIIGNFGDDPLFGAGYTGQWTDDAVYNPDTGQTILTNANANWVANELAGMGLNSDTNAGYYQYYVAGNSAKAVWVWGDATEGISGDNYKVYDYHLQSGIGRWVSGTETWAHDAKFSPCIDAGDPTDDYSNEPDPNGDRINVGVFGGTDTASKTAYIGTVILIN